MTRPLSLHRRAVLAKTFDVRVPLSYHGGPLGSALLGTVAAVAVARLATTPAALYSAVTIAGLATFGGCLWLWMRLTGTRLAIAGFVADSSRNDPPSSPSADS